MDVIEKEYTHIAAKLSSQFGEELDLKGILFLIGVQELGEGYRKFSKDEKVEVIHVAICRLLSQYNYYEFLGRDDDGWPHWKENGSLPKLEPKDQLKIIKQSISDYFKENNQ